MDVLEGEALGVIGRHPIGVFVDPERVAADSANGLSFEEIHAKAMAGGYTPEQAPVRRSRLSPAT